MTKMEKLYNEHKNFKKTDIILDVRTPEEYEEGHVPGSKNIPHEEVQNHVDELKKYSTVYIHCRSGKRAGKAFKTLTDLGLKNLSCIDDSGMIDWIEKGHPIEK